LILWTLNHTNTRCLKIIVCTHFCTSVLFIVHRKSGSESLLISGDNTESH